MSTALAETNSKTKVSLSATFDINGSTVVLNSQALQDLKAGKVVFSITEPVEIGTPGEFAEWLNGQIGGSFKIPDPSTITEPKLQEAYKAFYDAKIQIDVLVVNQPQKIYKFGISAKTEFDLIGPLKFTGIGVLVESDQSGS